MKRLLMGVLVGLLLFGCALPPEEVAKRRKADAKDALEDARNYTTASDCINGHEYEVRIYPLGNGNHITSHIPVFDENGLAKRCEGSSGETE